MSYSYCPFADNLEMSSLSPEMLVGRIQKTIVMRALLPMDRSALSAMLKYSEFAERNAAALPFFPVMYPTVLLSLRWFDLNESARVPLVSFSVHQAMRSVVPGLVEAALADGGARMASASVRHRDKPSKVRIQSIFFIAAHFSLRNLNIL